MGLHRKKIVQRMDCSGTPVFAVAAEDDDSGGPVGDGQQHTENAVQHPFPRLAVTNVRFNHHIINASSRPGIVAKGT
jgi:hypothetical protein